MLPILCLLYNTYYPISIANSYYPITNHNLLRHANCLWYNNHCNKSIEDEFPNLSKYNHITINEINLHPNVLSRIITNTKQITPIIRNKHHIIYPLYEIVITPLAHNRTKLFIFSNS